jgi:hypothetical protein
LAYQLQVQVSRYFSRRTAVADMRSVR